jgi:hypothetical protein
MALDIFLNFKGTPPRISQKNNFAAAENGV